MAEQIREHVEHIARELSAGTDAEWAKEWARDNDGEIPGGGVAYAIHDDSPHEPDADGTGDVFNVQRGRFEQMASDERAYPGSSQVDASTLQRAWDHFRDWDLVERYLRVFYDVVSFSVDAAYPGSDYIGVVTAAHWKAWGNTELLEPGDSEVAAGCTAEWREWAAGNVYGVAATYDDQLGLDDAMREMWESR